MKAETRMRTFGAAFVDLAGLGKRSNALINPRCQRMAECVERVKFVVRRQQ
jgi:hypothetical protein